MHLKIWSAKWRHFCPREDELKSIKCILYVLCHALSWFGTGQFHLYSFGLLHCHWSNNIIAQTPLKQPKRIWAKWPTFEGDLFKSNFLNENIWISINISLKFVPKGPINNMPALVQIMDWRRPGDKPLSEPMMASLLMHISVTRLQRVFRLHNSSHCKLSATTGKNRIPQGTNTCINISVSA